MADMGKGRRRPPNGEFRKFGFGLAGTPREERGPRLKAAADVLAMLDGSLADGAEDRIPSAVSRVRDLYAKAGLGDAVDWATVSAELGYPSARFAAQVAGRLSDLGDGLRRRDGAAVSEAIDWLRAEPVADSLDHYVSVAGGSERLREEKGWLYVLWSSSEPDILYVNATDGTLAEACDRIGCTKEYRSHHPYGVLAAWLVDDPREARDAFAAMFDDDTIGDRFYRADLGKVKDSVQAMLDRRGISPESPWHGDEADEGAAMPQPALAA